MAAGVQRRQDGAHIQEGATQLVGGQRSLHRRGLLPRRTPAPRCLGGILRLRPLRPRGRLLPAQQQQAALHRVQRRAGQRVRLGLGLPHNGVLMSRRA
eukprot:COSAG01_NODE_690_length_14219_cov_19.783144_15_plen_98_part_00